MAYTAQDKYDFAIKDVKYSIGQGRGSAMGNAIEWAIAKGLSLEEAFEISDKIFHYQQVNIAKDFETWKELNDQKLKIEVGLEGKVIQDGIEL